METPPEDPQYLKDYIKEHPTNKMAWYLLGRQYAAKGETGKANYCFAQAAEVYRAFEEGGVVGETGEQENESSGETDASVVGRSERKRHFWKSAVIALLLLLASYIPTVPDRSGGVPAGGALPANTGGMAAIAGTAPQSGGGGPHAADSFDVVYVLGGSAESRTKHIAELLLRLHHPTSNRASTLLLAEPTWIMERRWLLWPAQTKPIVAAEQSEGESGRTRLTYYEADACHCEPADRTVPDARYAEWQHVRLQQLVVRSAIASYEAAYGRPPESIEQMVRNYPDNWMAGYTSEMKTHFDRLKAERQLLHGESAESGMSSPGSFEDRVAADSSLLPAAEALEQPLRILVDKTTHTLALVSGNVLLRSYPVGLGGDRTPEGEFTITEKVRNPNGRDNGTFGSRGMTLSDTLYAIHGTNQPSTIGKDKSLGCIRMLKPDVEELFDLVPKGTKVVIGQHLLIPTEPYRSETPMRVPSSTDETNPNKVYKWLD